MPKSNNITATPAIAAPGLAGLSGCASTPAIQSESSSSYQQVDAEAAKKMMDEEKDYAILDARTQAEYDQGHIPSSILMPHDTVVDAAEGALPNKDRPILVYCRSGNPANRRLRRWRTSATQTWLSSAASTAGHTISSDSLIDIDD